MSSCVRSLLSETKPATSRKLLLDFSTPIPCCWTSWGSSGMASCSLFCTCTCAMSGSVPDWKVSVMVTLPAESLVDDIYIRLSIPFMFCSITCVTVSCTVCASAPGYVAVIATAGGAMVGYCAMGSLRIASPPAIIKMMASTQAKTGRWIKKLAMSSSLNRLESWWYQASRRR